MDKALEQVVVEEIRRLAPHGTRISSLGDRIRETSHWTNIKDAQIKAVIFPLVMKGELKYTPDLKITVAKAKAAETKR